jgi:hypothetical protein
MIFDLSQEPKSAGSIRAKATSGEYASFVSRLHRSIAMNHIFKPVFLAGLIVLPLPAAAQDGHLGHGHDTWHAEFYSKLLRPDTKTSCCNLSDCRPTEIRSAGDHYEVKKDNRWIRVPAEKIVKVAPPDGGAHICAPSSESTTWGPDEIFCIIMPFET